MTGVVLKAEKREELGSSSSRKIRLSGNIPAIIYGNEGNTNLTVNAKEFEFEYFKGDLTSTVIEIELDGKKTKVIAHQIDVDPVSDRPVHVDFFSCEKGKVIKAQPKVKFINRDKSIGIKKGGFLNVSLRKINVLCEGEVPATIEVDIAKMRVGDKIRGSDLVLPEGVKLAKKGTYLVAGILGRASKDDAETEATAEGAAAPAEKKEAEKK